MNSNKTYCVSESSRVRAESSIFQLRIKELLVERGKSPQWLADELGLSVSYITSMMYGTNPTSISRLCDIAKVLKIEFRDLFKNTGWTTEKARKRIMKESDGCRTEVDLCDEITFSGGTADPGRYIVITNPSAYEVCTSGASIRTDGYINKLSKSLNMSISDTEDVLCGKKPVSPEDWYSMCKVLKDKAYRIMPNIRVSVSINKMGDTIFVNE